MNEQQLREAFMQYLQQKSGAQTQQEFEAYIQLLGEEGLLQEYAQFMQLLQQLQVAARKFGGMLNYIGQLRGVCPEGTEMLFFKQGGQVCKKCVQKAKMQEGGETPQNPVDAFKCGRKMKRVKKNEAGATLKFEKTSKNKLGDTVTTRTWSDGTTSKRYIPEEGMEVYVGRRGESGVALQDSLWRADWSSKTAPRLKPKKALCGTKLPKDKCGSKVEMDKCGKKMKKKACGGPVKKGQTGGALPTAEPAYKRYEGGSYRGPAQIRRIWYPGYYTVESESLTPQTEYVNGPKLAFLENAQMSLNYDPTLGDSTITEIPAHFLHSTGAWWEPSSVKVRPRTASNDGKNPLEWQIMKRRWEEAKKVTR